MILKASPGNVKNADYLQAPPVEFVAWEWGLSSPLKHTLPPESLIAEDL